MTASASNEAETWVSVSVRTDIGMRRAGNEDNLQVVDLTTQRVGLTHREAALLPDVAWHRLGPLGTLLIVSDGMGGAAAGEVASEMAVKIVTQEMLQQIGKGVPSSEAMRSAAERANAAIWERSQNESAVRGLGATLTAVHLSAQGAVVAQVGDSRAYLIRNGTIRQLTEDQSWAAAAKKAGMPVANVPSNVILQALGTQRVVNTDITTETIQPGDIFLLCSDGLSNKIEAHELVRYVTNADSLSAAAEDLVRVANERGGEDNVTVVIAEVARVGCEVLGNTRVTQLFTSAAPTDDKITSKITPEPVTTELHSVETCSNLSPPAASVESSSSPPAERSTRLLASPNGSAEASAVSPPTSTGGKLFVVLALAAVGLIVVAGVAAMVWVLHARAAKQSASGKEPSVMQPADLPSDVRPNPPSVSPTPSGIGRKDDSLTPDLVDLEKKLKLAKQQADELAARMQELPGYEDVRKACQANRDRLKQLADTLDRHRRREAGADDLSVANIEQEVNRITEWMDGLPLPPREAKEPGRKGRPEEKLLDKATKVLEQGSEVLLPHAFRSSLHP